MNVGSNEACRRSYRRVRLNKTTLRTMALTLTVLIILVNTIHTHVYGADGKITAANEVKKADLHFSNGGNSIEKQPRIKTPTCSRGAMGESKCGMMYWVRPGAYAVYESYGPLRINLFRGMRSDSNGTIHEYYCQLVAFVRLRWVVLRVKGSMALVNFTLTLISPGREGLKCEVTSYLFRKGAGGAFVSYYPDPQIMGMFVGTERGEGKSDYVVLGSNEVSWSRLVWVNLVNSSIVVNGRAYPESFMFFVNPCLISGNKSIYQVKTFLDGGRVRYVVYVFSNFTSIFNERVLLTDGSLLNVALPIFKRIRELVPSSPLSGLGLGRVYVTHCYGKGSVEKNISSKPLTILDISCGWAGDEPPSFYDLSSGIMLALTLYSVEARGKEVYDVGVGSWGVLYRLFNVTDVFMDPQVSSVKIGKYVVNYSFIYLKDTNVPLRKPVFGGVIEISSLEWWGLSLAMVAICAVASVVVWRCERH